MHFSVFIIIVVTALIFKTFMNRSNRSYNPNREFLERERQANLTPAKSLEDLPYIRIDPHLPLDVPSDKPETLEKQDTIRKMSEKKILNFTGKSNTDLKLEYGAANINFLTSCDMNYTRLVQNIASLAEDYLNSGHEEEAKALLEYGIEIGTDVTKNYTLLAALYRKSGESEKIAGPILQARDLNSLSKSVILKNLEEASAANP